MERPIGCATCWPDDALTASTWTPAGNAAETLVDDSHFMVHLAQCDLCGQRYVSIFCETIDWAHGNDPQTSIRFAVTDQHAGELRTCDDRSIGRALARIGSTTRRIEAWWPSNGSTSPHWAEGPFRLPPHH
jgi:chorismate-pyruvate lyase